MEDWCSICVLSPTLRWLSPQAPQWPDFHQFAAGGTESIWITWIQNLMYVLIRMGKCGRSNSLFRVTPCVFWGSWMNPGGEEKNARWYVAGTQTLELATEARKRTRKGQEPSPPLFQSGKPEVVEIKTWTQLLQKQTSRGGWNNRPAKWSFHKLTYFMTIFQLLGGRVGAGWGLALCQICLSSRPLPTTLAGRSALSLCHVTHSLIGGEKKTNLAQNLLFTLFFSPSLILGLILPRGHSWGCDRD